jgi:ATP/maltotriose-dependent transcriptional regulator MalT
MDPAMPIAQRFPLIARSRPPCTALSARISALAELADRAARDGDLTAASRVHNQAALIASDCGQPDLAEVWCHRHARAWLDHGHLDTTTARHALEPLVNLARLRIRAGDRDGGFDVIGALYRAVLTRTDIVVDGVAVPVAALTQTTDRHQDVCRWLWGVHLADGTRALTTAGRWHDAENHLQEHNGIGRRMLDGRQVAVIARAINDQRSAALRMLTETEPGEPWEAAVTACLTALCQPAERPPTAHLDAMISNYHQLDPDPTLVVFHTRLALSIIDIGRGITNPALHATTQHAVDRALVAGDGYAARDLLNHHEAVTTLTAQEINALTAVLHQSGLSQPLPDSATRLLDNALRATESVIASTSRRLSSTRAPVGTDTSCREVQPSGSRPRPTRSP